MFRWKILVTILIIILMESKTNLMEEILNRQYACSFKMFLEKHACFKMLYRRIEYLGVVELFHDEALSICNWSVQLFIPLDCIKTKSIICFALKFSN